MATILSSKTFAIPKGSDMPVRELGRWYCSVKHLCDCTLTVTLKAVGGSRKIKLAAEKELSSLFLIGNSEGLFTTRWQKDGYEFDFRERKYYWRGKEIYLTVGEQLYLYRWLVLGEDYKVQWYYLRNMRTKFGKDFLVEMTKGVGEKEEENETKGKPIKHNDKVRVKGK